MLSSAHAGQRGARVSLFNHRQERPSLVSRTALQRLTRRGEFDEVLAHGKACGGQYFIVRACAVERPRARLGIIAGRKAIPRAVDRNRCKRIVREAFRARQGSLPALDMVVVCRRPLLNRDRSRAREELERLLSAVGDDTRQRKPCGTSAANDDKKVNLG